MKAYLETAQELSARDIVVLDGRMWLVDESVGTWYVLKLIDYNKDLAPLELDSSLIQRWSISEHE